MSSPIRILATGDWHDCRAYHDQVAPAAEYFVEAVERERPDLVLFSGDLYHRSGEHSSLELYFTRTMFERIRAVCPVVCIPGNHDRNNIATEPDSLKGAFLFGDTEEPSPGLHVISDPKTLYLDIPEKGSVAVLCLPYPSRVQAGEGTTLAPDEVANLASQRLLAQMRGLASEIPEDIPSILLFHGSVEGGILGPEQVIETDGEVSLRQTDIPPGISACVAGHLHIPQEAGRMMYTGSVACPTWHERSVRPSFLELVLVRPSEGPTCLFSNESFLTRVDGSNIPVQQPTAGWFNPNSGWPADSRWAAEARRWPIPVAQPLLSIELRGRLPLDAPQSAILSALEERVDDILGARVRVRAAVRKAQRAAYDKSGIEAAMLMMGAASAQLILEYRPDQAFTTIETLHGSTSIDRAMDLFLACNPDLDRHRAAIQSLAKEIEDGLPDEVKTESEPVAYRLVSLDWENWKQHGKGSIDISAMPGIVSIEGPNFSGKSNLAELEAHVLWGAVRSDLGDERGRRNLVRAVRNGQKMATTIAVFESHGERYRVTRTVKLSGDPDALKAAGSVAIERWTGGGWGDRITGTDAQKQIVQRVGTLKTYLDTRLSSQKEIDRIFGMGLADLQRTIHEACHLATYEHRHKAGEAVEREARGRMEVAQAADAEARRQAEGLQEANQALTDRQIYLETTTATRTALESARSDAEAELGRVRSLAGAVEGFLAAVGTATTARDAATARCLAAAQSMLEASQKLVLRRRDVENAETLVGEIDALRARCARLTEAETEMSALIQSKGERDDLEKKIVGIDLRVAGIRAAAAQDLARWTREADGLTAKIRQVAAGLEAEKAILARKRAEVERLLMLKRDTAALIDRAPCAEAPTVQVHGEQVVLKDVCPLLATARMARDEADEIQTDLDSWNDSSPKLIELLGQKTALLEQQAAHEMTKPGEPVEDITRLAGDRAGLVSQLELMTYDSSKYADIQREIAGLMQAKVRDRLDAARAQATQVDSFVAAVAAAESTLAAARERAESAQAEVDTASANVAIAEQQLRTALDEHQPAIATATRALEDVKIRLAEAQHAADNATRDVGQAEAKVAGIRAAAERAEETGGALALAHTALTVATAYRSAVSRTGIPFLIGERALPYIEERANTYLRDANKAIRFVTDETEFDIYFVDDTGEHHRSEASGFDGAAMGIACRLAMADAAEMFGGARARHYIQDEGFGACEQGNVLILIDVLREAAKTRDTIIVISHIPAVHLAADHRIRVVYDPVNGSRVEGGVAAGSDEGLVLQ